MSDIIDIVVNALSYIALAGGAIFVVIGGIGLIRFPEFFTRLHAAGVTDTLGAGLILVGLMLQSGFTQNTLKLGIMLLLIFVTSPTASHALAKAAVYDSLNPWTVRNDAEDDDGDDDEKADKG